MAGRFPKRNYEPRPRRDAGERGGRKGHPRDQEPAPPQPPPAGEAAPTQRQRGEDSRPRQRPARQDRGPRPEPAQPAAPTAWDEQAAWYDQHQGQGGDDFYTALILPAVLRQLAKARLVLDVCCGQGVLGRALAAREIATLGVDASPALVEAARRRAGPLEQHLVGDARALPALLGDQRFDAASLVMALQDLDPIEGVLAGIAKVLRPGGRCVIVLTHPCFRIPKRTAWGWDEQWGIQYRRVDAYLSPASLPIKIHPGMPADPSRTTSFHRPLSTYVNACGAAGLGIIAMEELCSHRRGTKGARYQAEDRAAREIPQFLVITAQR